MMLKKIKKLQINNINPTLNVSSTLKKYFKEEQLIKLFQSQQSQYFQLQYLNASPLVDLDLSFAYLLSILEDYNNSIGKEGRMQDSSKGIVKVACMRLIYKQMLNFVIKNEDVIRYNLADKLKRWYDNICGNDIVNGMWIRKRDNRQQQIIEQIRQKYLTNVFDEIDNYERKKLIFEDRDKLQFNNKIRCQSTNNLNLPFLDIKRYRKLYDQLNYQREKSQDRKYYNLIKQNMSSIKKYSLKKCYKYQDRINTLPNQQINKNYGNILSLHVSSSDFNHNCHKKLISKEKFKKYSNSNKKSPNIRELIESRKKDKIMLTDINGLNLIQHRM